MRISVWIFSVAVATLIAGGCNRRPDAEENVRKALDQANLHVDVDINDEANIVHLSGTVDTIADRTRAEEVARAAVGTSGQVLNELTVTTLADRTADDPDSRLRDALDQLVDADPVLRERDVNFEVRNGDVAITGEVRTAEEKTRTARIAKAVHGVKEVTNRLEIRPE
jgi:osmotically-inducible protein OsmY